MEGVSEPIDKSAMELALRQRLVVTLRLHADGNPTAYDELVQEFQTLVQRSVAAKCPLEQNKLRILLLGLAGCASEILPQHHNALCSILLDTQFIQHPSLVQEALVEVFFGLMVTHCGWIPGCLSSLAISLIPFKPQIAIKNPKLKWESPEPLVEIHTRILDLIQKVHGLIPSVAMDFLKSLYSKQPFFMRNCESHCLYLTAVFGVLKRPMGRHLHKNLWAMVVHHLLDVDVNIHARNLTLQSDASHLFSCDLEDEKPLRTDSLSRQDSTLLTVMDSMMELIFEELERHLTEQNLDLMWDLMLELLDDLFIASYEAQFAHFLVFYLVQKKPQQWSETLVKRCLAKLEDLSVGGHTRSAYALYGASFLARAKFVATSVKMQFLEALLVICEQYARRYQTTDYDTPEEEPDILPYPTHHSLASKHFVFYNYMQAVLYLLCYLMPQHCQKQRRTNEHTHERMRVLVQTRLSPLLHHRLRPLEFVNSAVAIEFCELNQQLDIIHCGHLIDPSRLFEQRNRLSVHFPFDPYPLVRSSAYLNLEESYLSWSEVTADLGHDDMELEDEQPGEERLMEALSLEDNFTPGSSLPFCGSGGSSLLSDGLN